MDYPDNCFTPTVEITLKSPNGGSMVYIFNVPIPESIIIKFIVYLEQLTDSEVVLQPMICALDAPPIAYLKTPIVKGKRSRRSKRKEREDCRELVEITERDRKCEQLFHGDSYAILGQRDWEKWLRYFSYRD